MPNKKNIGPLKKMARGAVRKEIDKQERKVNRELTREEKKKVQSHVFKKLRTRAAILASVGLLGIGSGVVGFRLGQKSNEIKGITSGQNIEIDVSEVEKDVNIKTTDEKDARQVFLDNININNYEQKTDYEMLATNEIENLKTFEDVLNYTKQIYVDEFNKNNEEQISVEDIRLSQNRSDIVFYKDVAENGDEILRYCSEYEAKEMGIGIDGDTPMLTVYIANKDINATERVAQKQNGEIVNLYGKNEEVSEDKETTLEEVGDVLFAGIDRASSMEQEGTSIQNKENYKNKFINKVAKYKEQNNNKSQEKSTDDYEH